MIPEEVARYVERAELVQTYMHMMAVKEGMSVSAAEMTVPPILVIVLVLMADSQVPR